MHTIPFDPERNVDKWEYSVSVVSLAVVFATRWQLYAAANKTYAELKAAFPNASVRVTRRGIPDVEDVTP